MDLSTNNIASLVPILIARINELEKEKHNLEIELHTYETKYNELNIVATGYMDTIRELREEKQRLETELAELCASNAELKASNVELIARVNILEEKEANKELLLKIAQCVYDYKNKLKARIDPKLKSKWELFDIINGCYDKYLSSDAKVNRAALITEIETKYSSVRELQTMLGDTTADRVKNAHPIISGEYLALKKPFLEYCNNKWADDIDTNIIFTDDVFSVLLK